jgi:hypothetical protein
MIKQPLLQLISSQTDVTASRVADGTVYHNTSTKPIFVSVSLGLGPVTQGEVFCDANANPTLVVAFVSNSNLASIYAHLFFLVLPGYYYKVTGNQTIFAWIEYT